MTFECSFPVLPLAPSRHAVQDAAEARGRAIAVGRQIVPAAASSLAGGQLVRTCAADGCDVRFEAKGKRKYCSGRCRSRVAGRAYTARKAERADAEWRMQTEQLHKLHRDEGYLNGS